jgi:hypothetical protein
MSHRHLSFLHRCLYNVMAYSFVNTSCPENVAALQSVPVKSASIRVACAVPTLPNVPLHPRGDMNVPCVLICVGGVLLGEMAVVAVVIMFSHECSERMVLLKDCRFEFGITANVHVIGPLVAGDGFGACGLTWIVTVPRHVPARKDCSEGAVGVASRPHAATERASTHALQRTGTCPSFVQ